MQGRCYRPLEINTLFLGFPQCLSICLCLLLLVCSTGASLTRETDPSQTSLFRAGNIIISGLVVRLKTEPFWTCYRHFSTGLILRKQHFDSFIPENWNFDLKNNFSEKKQKNENLVMFCNRSMHRKPGRRLPSNAFSLIQSNGPRRKGKKKKTKRKKNLRLMNKLGQYWLNWWNCGDSLIQYRSLRPWPQGLKLIVFYLKTEHWDLKTPVSIVKTPELDHIWP